MALHGCTYLGGRAASAPQVREGETTRATKTSGGGGLVGTTGDGPSDASPTMLLFELRCQALDDAYPPMQVPADESVQDAVRDEDDATFQTGLREAVGIAKGARDHGRTRKMSPSTQPSSSTAKEAEGVVKPVEEEDLATVRSALGRRGSKREDLASRLLEQFHLAIPDVHLTRENALASVACLSLPDIVSQSDRGSCVLYRLARAVSPRDDHLEDTPHF